MIQTTHTIGGHKKSSEQTYSNVRGNSRCASARLENILPRLEIFCLRDQVWRFLRGGSDFRRLESRCHQIAFVRDIAEWRYNISRSTNALAKAFDCPRFRVKSALQHGMDPPGQRGKHTALDDDRERQIIHGMQQNTE
jgi:hypothetical protein